MKRCIIVGAGEFFPGCMIHKNPDDLLIAADGGYNHLKSIRLRPDLLVADFDSLTNAAPSDVPLLRLKPEKDDTDMGVAIAEGLRRGYTEFLLYGGTGGRADHTFANYQALVNLARSGMRAYLMDNEYVITALCNSEIALNPLSSGFVSVFAVDNQCEGVSIKGLKYELDRASLTNAYPIGVSNEFVGQPAKISVEQGTLLVFCPTDALFPN